MQGVEFVVQVDGVGSEVFEATELGIVAVAVAVAQVVADLVPEQVLDELVGDLFEVVRYRVWWRLGSHAPVAVRVAPPCRVSRGRVRILTMRSVKVGSVLLLAHR